MQVLLFENQYYPNGIWLTSCVPGADIKVLNFNSPNPQDRKKFTDGLRQSIGDGEAQDRVGAREADRHRATQHVPVLQPQKGVRQRNTELGLPGRQVCQRRGPQAQCPQQLPAGLLRSQGPSLAVFTCAECKADSLAGRRMSSTHPLRT
ncbi:IQ motif and SEC7 domain-containing protein 1 [Plecturocebus cupreus]